MYPILKCFEVTGTNERLSVNLNSPYTNVLDGKWQICVDGLYVNQAVTSPIPVVVTSNFVMGEFVHPGDSIIHREEVALGHFQLNASPIPVLYNNISQKFFEITNRSLTAKFEIRHILRTPIDNFQVILIILLRRVA